ncbi:MAG: ATP-grasp domain-containing protein [Pseudomonadota bacterium]
MANAYVIHENNAWVEPLRTALRDEGVPYQEWFLDRGTLDLGRPPPAGVFYNRMSASSHTRDHRYAAEYTAAVLAWLEAHGRRVLNNSRALRLEISKAAQYAALAEHGIPTPRTVAAVGREELLKAAQEFSFPFILKPNRGGKGVGVRLFRDLDALRRHLDGPEFEASVDGINLVQAYIEAPEPFITRAEFVGRRFLYALRVDTRQGFELCPADDCQPGDAFCPTSPTPPARFSVLPRFDHPILDRYRAFITANGIHIAGIEFIRSRNGALWTYDVNTNTNYNPEAEAAAGVSGMGAIAKYLGGQLARQYGVAAGRGLALA